MIVGLTGGIGSGKTTVSNLFMALGIAVVDADIIAREVVEPDSVALAKIVAYFGVNILAEDGRLNRSKLRALVFHNPTDKTWLNSLLHPIIRAEITQQLAACQSPYAILVAPLLFENGLNKQVNRTLVIDVPINQQIERTIKRDGSNQATIEHIIAAQMPRKERLAKADDIIDNDSANIDQLKVQVHHLHDQYLMLATTFSD